MPKEKPKKAVHKQVGERKEKHVKHHEAIIDEHGNIVEEARDEEIEVVVPVMGTVYEEMTQAEIDELEKQQDLPHVPTLEERVEALEECVTELERLVAKLSGKPKPKH